MVIINYYGGAHVSLVLLLLYNFIYRRGGHCMTCYRRAPSDSGWLQQRLHRTVPCSAHDIVIINYNNDVLRPANYFVQNANKQTNKQTDEQTHTHTHRRRLSRL